ncbi:hypothetical protein DL93DRAFT_463831 [Clavulina sp. PMI_390]|nr:hypothetical protein DL93DRAFT_463831 [Clavulina sp. PMI_390]
MQRMPQGLSPPRSSFSNLHSQIQCPPPNHDCLMETNPSPPRPDQAQDQVQARSLSSAHIRFHLAPALTPAQAGGQYHQHDHALASYQYYNPASLSFADFPLSPSPPPFPLSQPMPIAVLSRRRQQYDLGVSRDQAWHTQRSLRENLLRKRHAMTAQQNLMFEDRIVAQTNEGSWDTIHPHRTIRSGAGADDKDNEFVKTDGLGDDGEKAVKSKAGDRNTDDENGFGGLMMVDDHKSRPQELDGQREALLVGPSRTSCTGRTRDSQSMSSTVDPSPLWCQSYLDFDKTILVGKGSARSKTIAAQIHPTEGSSSATNKAQTLYEWELEIMSSLLNVGSQTRYDKTRWQLGIFVMEQILVSRCVGVRNGISHGTTYT